MSEAQNKAFEIATGGDVASVSSHLFLGLCVTAVLVWGAWALLTTWKGWACGNVTSGQLGGTTARVLLVITLLFWFVLS